MSGYNRLTNGLRDALSKLPIWTTEADRRRALSYEDKHLDGIYEAINAVQAGHPAPTSLSLLIAIARYEDGGWMPDGCFERWRRWKDRETEQLNVKELVLWLDSVESEMRQQQREHEEVLTNDCRKHDRQVALDQDSANHAHERLHAHHKKWILACLSIGDITEAQEIAQRMPAGPGRREIDQLLRKHATPTPVLDVVREACIAELFAGTTPSDIVLLAERIAQRTAARLILPEAAESAPPVAKLRIPGTVTEELPNASRDTEVLATTELPTEVLRGLQLLRRHLNDNEPVWHRSTPMADVRAARAWLNRLKDPK
jgi:hypothetical protein